MFELLTKIKLFPSIYRYSSTSTSMISLCDNLRPEDKLCYDVTVIGGGIVGAAIAREITEKSKNVKSLLIEKENVLGEHQSSHNSGVIHAGIYYKPNSLKAKLCPKGVDLILNYCKENNIPHTTGGKLIVATDYSQIDVLRALQDRGLKNDVGELKMLWTKDQIKEVEPKCRGVQALWCPRTGNVDWGVVTERFGKDFRKNGGDILLNTEVELIKESPNCDYPILIRSSGNYTINTRYLILCGGLHSGRLSSMIDGKSDTKSKVVSFRVEYKLLDTHSIKTNIYSVPDMEVPFLGVHVTPRVDGRILLGPTALPAYRIDGYRNNDICLGYLASTVTSANFQTMARRYLSICIDQARKTLCKDLQIKELQNLTTIPFEDIKQGPTAVQAQIIKQDGSFTDDFLFEFFEGDGIRKRVINCKFMPSPAATCSMSIAEFVTDKFFQQYPR